MDQFFMRINTKQGGGGLFRIFFVKPSLILFGKLMIIICRWAAQIAHQGQLAHHIGKRQVDGVITPGNIPGLVPGSEAARQW